MFIAYRLQFFLTLKMGDNASYEMNAFVQR